jgi:hypothetical protein
MLKQLTVFLVMVLLSTTTFISGCASPGVQPQPLSKNLSYTGEAVQGKVVSRIGETVRLFHGGTEQAKEVFCLNETVPVYRQVYGRYGEGEYKEVGKVKITQYLGKYDFDADVVEGDLQDGDIAMKQSAACLVRLPGPKEK